MPLPLPSGCMDGRAVCDGHAGVARCAVARGRMDAAHLPRLCCWMSSRVALRCAFLGARRCRAAISGQPLRTAYR